MARPAGGPNHSASEQKEEIYNKNFFGGVAHEANITSKLRNSLKVFSSYSDYKNQIRTNYEFRKEKNLGLLTYLSYKDTIQKQVTWQMQLGFKGQKGWSSIENYDNNQGTPGNPQAFDELDNLQGSFFYRAMIKLYKRWTIEASLRSEEHTSELQ